MSTSTYSTGRSRRRCRRTSRWWGRPPGPGGAGVRARDPEGTWLAEVGIDLTVKTLAAGLEPPEGGSTDVSEVSRITPTVGLLLASTGKDLPGHSWAASASHGQPGAGKVAVAAAKVLAMTGVDLLTQPKLLAKAKADFLKRTEGKPYRSPIPAGHKLPLP